jgi:hypothetical protein
MLRAALCTTLVAAGLMMASQAALAESRMALVIGQSAYRAVTPLPNPANDAKAMTQMLGDAGFEVISASDLSRDGLRDQVADFTAKVAAKGPDTVALVFYAGHGLQIDGENFLVPVDIDPKRETDIPLQAVRLNDILNTLTSVPSKTRIILLDACRNNPFPAISAGTGRGLAHVDVKLGAAGTLLSFSTSPGAEAEDGSGANSPYTDALLKAGREPGLSIEETFKRVRLSVNKVTEGRQTPWESSSLTDQFSFFADAGGVKPATPKRSVEEWRRALKGKPIAEANDMVVYDGSGDAYEAFVGLYTEPPLGPQAKEWLDRHRRMVAWNNAVIRNTGAAYRAFLAQFPDSDLTPTATRLAERMRNRLPDGGVAAAAPTNVALTCPCGPAAPAPALQKANVPKANAAKPKRAEPEPPKRASAPPPRPRPQVVDDYDDDVVVVRRPPIFVQPLPGRIIGGGGGYGRDNGGSFNRGRY